MSATLDPDLFKRAFPEAHTEDIPPTAFVNGTKVYQLRTNRNPRATVYQVEDAEVVGLSSTGENYWQRMIHEIARTPATQHAIITYKLLFEWKQNEETSDLSELDNITATAHYGNLVGLDTDFQDADTLWILFAPEIPHHEIQWRAKLFFGDDTEPLNYDRDENGVYLDKRLQKVWENAVIAELIQAIGRARLVRKARTVIILTSHFIPGITDRAETQLFDEADWEIAGSIEGLDTAITNREAAEQRAAALTADNTIADFQEIYGCSERHARRLWEQAGGQENKTDTDNEQLQRILEMKAQGLSIRKIADTLGFSRGKVEGILRKSKVS